MSSDQEPRCPLGFIQWEGFSPTGDGLAWFILSKGEFLGNVRDRSIRNKQLEAYLVPKITEQPDGIWEGLDRDGKQTALAYVGRSDRFHGDITIQLPPQPGKVFAVYIRETLASAGQFIIDYWEHVPEDIDNPGFPEKHRRRYGRRLWPKEE